MEYLDEICNDFGVVRQFDDPDRVLAIRDALSDIDEVRVARSSIDRFLEDPLTTREAASLFACLQKNGAARQASSEGGHFADYEFEIRRDETVRVLTQQAAALVWQRSGTEDTEIQSNASLVATLPGGFEPSAPNVRNLQSIVDTIRGQIFDADSAVRIANPYFTPSLELISDLASLPRRGIETRILTRETGDAGGDARTALNTMWRQIDDQHRDDLVVRDLYQWDDQRDSQAFATHAKTVIVDDSTCYVGSANLTDTSLATNFEFGVVVDGELVSDAVALFDEIFEYSRPVEFPI